MPVISRRLRPTWVALAALIAAGTYPSRASAELIIGLTSTGALITFDSATPGTTTNIGTISGLTAGDTIVGIDRRPQRDTTVPVPAPGPNNNRIYAVGVNLVNGTARIYTLDEASAAATLVSTLAADPADTTVPFPFTTVSGTSFGVDFNPTVDRLRITSDTGQNLRMNVDNGLVQLDVPLTYQGGDPNIGETPIDVAVAYSNNFGGATTTTLRGVDIGQSTDLLVIHANPNGGLLMSGPFLPFDSDANIAYDVSGLSGTPYFSATSAGVTSFYSGNTLLGTVGGGVSLLGIAAPVGTVIPEPASAVLLGLGLAAAVAYARKHRRA